MMRWIIRSSLRLQFLLIVLAAALIVFGANQLRNVPVDIYPEFNPPLVEVQTEALGLSAAEVESLITVPMEADLLNGIAWLDRIYSESATGISSIHLIFEPGTPPIAARQMVQERLTQTFVLPNVSKPPTMLQPLSSTNRVMMVGISSDKLSMIDIGVLAHWNIKPRLMGVPGVANVAIWGGRERQLQVQVDPKKLNSSGVTLSQVIETTGEALWYSPLSYLESSSPGTAGWIDTPNQRLSIKHELPISTAEELAQVAVTDNNGLILGDVANVVEGHQPLIGEAIFDKAQGFLLVIEKFPGANTLDVTRGVEEALSIMQPGLTDVKFDTSIFKPATYIEQAIGNLNMLLIIGAILAILILGAFFLGFRTALISLIAVFLSFVSAGLVLYLNGVSFNMMTLAGLITAIGIVVDDAIIDVENISRCLRQRRLKDISSIILEAVYEVRSPIIYATLIILLTILPLYFIQGLAGAFFQPLVLSFVLAILSSMAVALIVTPVLSMVILNSPLKQSEPSVLKLLYSRYDKLLERLLKKPRRAYIYAGALYFIGLIVLSFLAISILPTFRQTDLLIEWEAVPGTSRLEMNRIMTNSSRELKNTPGVKNVGAHVGRAVMGDIITGVNSAELWVSLDSKANYDTTLKNIQEVIDGYPGLHRETLFYQPERTEEVLMGKDENLVVRIYGKDLKMLKGIGKDVEKVIAGVKGIKNVQTDNQIEEPQVGIKVDLERARIYGLKPGDIRRQATTLISGIQVGNLYDDQKVFGVVVWGVPEIRNSLTDISELMISTPDGQQVPLSELAKISIAPAPVIINRDSVSRFVDVEVSISGRDLSSITSDIKSRLQEVKFPLEYHAEVLNSSGAKESNSVNMPAIIAAIAIGIILLMQAAFGSWRLALTVFFVLPMALVGGVAAALIGGGILTLGSLVGFLTILGIAVRNSIMLISHYQHLQKNEGERFGPKLILRGSRERLAPILMTALTTGLILLPAIILGNAAGNEILRPMAIVILGGMFTSIYFSLLIIPILYLSFGRTNIGVGK